MSIFRTARKLSFGCVALASASTAHSENLELKFRYSPEGNARILTTAVAPDWSRLFVLDRTLVPCANPSACNYRSVVMLSAVPFEGGVPSLLFDGRTAASSPLAVQGSKSTLSRDGRMAHLVTNGPANEIAGHWVLTTNGRDTTGATLRNTGETFPLGTSLRFSVDGRTLVREGYAMGPEGGRDLSIPRESFWLGNLANVQVSPSGRYAYQEQGGNMYLYDARSGRMLDHVKRDFGRTWGTNQIRFVTDESLISTEIDAIRIFRIRGDRLVEEGRISARGLLLPDEEFHAAGVDENLGTVAYLSSRGRLGVWSLAEGRSLCAPVTHDTRLASKIEPVSIEFRDAATFALASSHAFEIHSIK